MSYVNKYTQVSEKTPIKNIGYAFLESGLLLKPYHGINQDGICTCKKGKECKAAGKHPILSRSGICSITTFIEQANKNPYMSVGLATGYNPATGKKLIVIDVDNIESIDWLRSLIPSIDNTFTIKTRKGFHFYFLVDGKNYVKTLINWNGKDVDILSGKQGVITIGSANKSIHQAVPMADLSPAEIKTLTSAKPLSKKTIKCSVEDKNFDVLHDAFYAGSIKVGSYHDSLFAVSAQELRRKANDFVTGTYTAEDHVTFLLDQAVKHLPLADMKQVEQIALSTCKTFDIEKMSMTFDRIWNIVFKNNDAYTSNTVLNVLTQSYKILNKDTEGEGKENCSGTSLLSLRKHLESKLVEAGITEPVIITDKQLVIFLSHLHPGMKKKETDKIIAGKRIRGMLWNISPIKAILDTEGEGKENCSGTSLYNINTSTVEQPKEKDMTKTEALSRRLMAMSNKPAPTPVTQQEQTQSQEPLQASVEEAKVQDDKVSVPEKDRSADTVKKEVAAAEHTSNAEQLLKKLNAAFAGWF